MELWKPVKWYEDSYMVSNKGRVYSLANKCILKPADNGNGYLRVSLYKEKKPKTKYVHVLVAEAFIDNPDMLTEVNHKDENKKNNNVENLEWCTHVYNAKWGTSRARGGLARRKKIYQYDLDGNFIKVWSSVYDVAKYFKVSTTLITNCIHGYSKRAKGFLWKYE